MSEFLGCFMVSIEKLAWLYLFYLRTFTVVPSQVPGTLSLSTYLREHLMLTGTKVMCNQAGCGACVVTAAVPDGVGKSKTISVNSVGPHTYVMNAPTAQ